jgi:hypothetical protein
MFCRCNLEVFQKDLQSQSPIAIISRDCRERELVRAKNEFAENSGIMETNPVQNGAKYCMDTVMTESDCLMSRLIQYTMYWENPDQGQA